MNVTYPDESVNTDAGFPGGFDNIVVESAPVARAIKTNVTAIETGPDVLELRNQS